MSETMIAALVGALVGGSFALLGGVLQHFLTLRQDTIRRIRDQEQKYLQDLRRILQSGDFDKETVDLVTSAIVPPDPEHEGITAWSICSPLLVKLMKAIISPVSWERATLMTPDIQQIKDQLNTLEEELKQIRNHKS